MAKSLPSGCFPTMITPFNADGSIDYPTLSGMVEWYIASGCTGLFAVCQSSEMYHMTDDERLAVARAVVKQADGRVSDASEELTNFGTAVATLGTVLANRWQMVALCWDPCYSPEHSG